MFSKLYMLFTLLLYNLLRLAITILRKREFYLYMQRGRGGKDILYPIHILYSTPTLFKDPKRRSLWFSCAVIKVHGTDEGVTPTPGSHTTPGNDRQFQEERAKYV